MHTNFLDTPWPAVGNAIGLVRIWDAYGNRDGSGTGAQWSDVNPAPGTYDWSGLDARVDAARSLGADVVYVLGGRTPRWASKRPRDESPYGEPGQPAEPKTMTIWQQWVRDVTTRYQGRIKYWEIWNEPDLRGFYTGSPDTLAQTAFATIKVTDPTNVVVSPGVNGYAGPGYLDYYLSQGGGNYADVIAYHGYLEDAPEGEVTWRTPAIRSVLQRYGQGSKPLWNTEQGWVGSEPIYGPELSKGYVARPYLLNWALGFDAFCYYTWDNGSNLILFTGPDRVTLTPAGLAYREVASWMQGAVIESLTTDGDGVYIATLRYPDDHRGRAVWKPGGSLIFTIPPTWGATVARDLEGGTTPVAESVAIGEAPVLLE